MIKSYINDEENIIPDNKIIIVPNSINNIANDEDIIESLSGNTKRDWFTSHFYYCLPLVIGNQYGFVIKSLRNFSIFWNGTESAEGLSVNFLDNDETNRQTITSHFGSGIITIQNNFTLRTPPGINIMTIQPPNTFIPGTAAMTGVIETDQLRRDFTFNLKVTIPGIKIDIRKGDFLGAFIPIPRYFVDNFSLINASEIFDKSIILNEIEHINLFAQERATLDKDKPHESGRRYFNGKHIDDTPYKDHQKRIVDKK